jgi:hypothetical protein
VKLVFVSSVSETVLSLSLGVDVTNNPATRIGQDLQASFEILLLQLGHVIYQVQGNIFVPLSHPRNVRVCTGLGSAIVHEH